MSVPNGSVTLVWNGGEHTFNIAKYKVALELEEKCNAGVGTIYNRLLSGMSMATASYYVNDFRETIRLGLIGGGMNPTEAYKLVVKNVDERPWQESIRPALVILQAAHVGVPGDDVGKEEADRAEKEQVIQGLSDPQSTEQAQR